MFNDFVRTNILHLSYKDMVATREIVAHERSLFYVVMGHNSLQFCHHFFQPSYVGNLIYGVVSAAVEEFVSKVQGSAIHKFRSTAMKIVLNAVRMPNKTIGSEFVHLSGIN